MVHLSLVDISLFMTYLHVSHVNALVLLMLLVSSIVLVLHALVITAHVSEGYVNEPLAVCCYLMSLYITA